MKQPYEVIKRFRITEKASQLASSANQYCFEVYKEANSIDVKHAVNKLFNVNVTNVNVLNRKGKIKRSRTQRGLYGKVSDVKIAFVTLKAGEKIEIV